MWDWSLAKVKESGWIAKHFSPPSCWSDLSFLIYFYIITIQKNGMHHSESEGLLFYLGSEGAEEGVHRHLLGNLIFGEVERKLAQGQSGH